MRYIKSLFKLFFFYETYKLVMNATLIISIDMEFKYTLNISYSWTKNKRIKQKLPKFLY